MNFYTKIPARFAAAKGLRLTLTVGVNLEVRVSKAKIGEMRAALREPGMSKTIDIEGPKE